MLVFPPVIEVAVPADSVRQRQQAEDFDQAWVFLRARYAWPERFRWDELKAAFRPKAKAADSREAFLRVMEALLEQFGDAHTHLGTNFDDSWWLPPGDMMGAFQGKEAWLTQVQPGSVAWQAGVRPGMRILGLGRAPLAAAMDERRPGFLVDASPDIERWTLNSLLAGRRKVARSLKLQNGSREMEVEVPPAVTSEPRDPAARLLAGNIGYIGFRDFGDMAQGRRMDEALRAFPQARAWVLDVRDNTGGDTAVICHIMGRFLKSKERYAWMAKRHGEVLGPLWPEYVKPRGKHFDGPLAVVVDGSTMSVAEGLAMGLQGLGRGVAVGLPMAGLGAAVHQVTLKHSGVRVQISTEPVFDTRQRPRNAFLPAVPVDVGSPENLMKTDPILDAAQATLRSLLPPR